MRERDEKKREVNWLFQLKSTNAGRETNKMVTCRKSSIFYTLICFCQILGTECDYTGSANHSLSLKTEGSVTIPCHYEMKYTQRRKYWFSDIDRSCTYTNTTMRNLSVIDYPDQSLFTVTMRDLNGTHSGPYHCAVETDGQPAIFFLSYYLDIKPVPDLSVVSSSITGQEGGNISVQCLYSSGNKSKDKQWCRYKDQICYTSQNSSVQISDDGRESFSVVMTGLTESDSGWYWCSVGDRQVPVKLTVTAVTHSENATNNTMLSMWLPASAAVLLLMALICVFIWRWRKRFNKEERKNQNRERNSAMTTETAFIPKDSVVYSTINDDNPNTPSLNPNTEMTYSTITDAPGCKAAFIPKDSVVYSTINDDNPNAPSLNPNTEMTYSTITDAPGCKAQSPTGGTFYSNIAPH
ncbi:CMRF35-like molecule 1 isoform X3 [Myxocyprinus asiaticus]|uniref:CMRF35-like molecule 1 isoform X3 n=1 Tax=Myxocyprinus asiaticus TaxID=70543 RepID=UPI002223D19A|nr:CMRF35-like molecule 1 isoform X3 [Myxocyprinus asiaticus]